MLLTKKVVIVLALIFLPAMSWAQGKVVVLDVEGAIMATDAAKAQFEKLQKSAEFAAEKAKLEAIQADIKVLQTTYQKDGLTWSPEQRAENEKKLQNLGAELQVKGKKLQSQQQAVAQQVMQQLGPKMEAIVKQLVESDGIGMIIDARSVMMKKPENDLTPKVIQLLNKAK